jgi:hypothetical protein
MSIIRNGLTRKALAGTALAALLLVGGAVAVPTAATAAPVVVTDEVDGTVFRAKLEASGSTISGDVRKTVRLPKFNVGYDVSLGTEGGIVIGTENAVLTLRRVGSDVERRFPSGSDGDTRLVGELTLPPTAIPGKYDVGLEITAKVKRGSQVTTHTVDVDAVKQVLLRRDTAISAEISNPEDTNSEPGTFSGTVKRLRVHYPTGDGYYSRAGGVTVRIYHSAEPDSAAVYVKSVKTNGAGQFNLPIRAKAGYWTAVAVGSDQYVWKSTFGIPQGVGCGC